MRRLMKPESRLKRDDLSGHWKFQGGRKKEIMGPMMVLE